MFYIMKTNTEILQLNEFYNIIKLKKPHIRILFCLAIFIFIIKYYNTNLNYLHLIVGFISSYSLYCIFGAQKTGDIVPFMLIINKMHIHHWMYASIFLLFAIHYNYNSLIIGILLGAVLHGIQFKDWNIIDKSKKL